MFDELNKVLIKNFSYLKESIKNEILKLRVSTSGRLINSIDYESNVSDINNLGASLSALSYWYYLDQGRGATKNTGDGSVKKNIKSWLISKGINDSKLNSDELAFLISKKIHEEGYEGFFFVDRVITTNFKNDLEKDISSSLKEDFLKIIFSE